VGILQETSLNIGLEINNERLDYKTGTVYVEGYMREVEPMKEIKVMVNG
jgi:hypothetical protein